MQQITKEILIEKIKSLDFISSEQKNLLLTEVSDLGDEYVEQAYEAVLKEEQEYLEQNEQFQKQADEEYKKIEQTFNMLLKNAPKELEKEVTQAEEEDIEATITSLE